jgi:lipopolysaccharide/colanic/teichoic acid biosynthesis glycosyltransferase
MSLKTVTAAVMTDATSAFPLGGAVALEPIPAWKRVLDVTVGGVALILLSPLMLVAAALIRLTSAGPVLFRQARVGRGERTFTMLKFRTMRVAPAGAVEGVDAVREELEGTATPDEATGLYRPVNDPRITAVGRFLRSTSIDELPQLFNVIRGEMSLVGPRPALPAEVELFTPEQRRRHLRQPGVTGLWQVGGRNLLSSREMLELDVDYVERCSLRLDLQILLRTPRAVLFDRNTR